MFKRTLIITPHFDDETIGCGGIISNIISKGYQLRIVVVATNNEVFNYSAGRIVENDERREECEQALGFLGIKDTKDILVQLEGFADGRLDQVDRMKLVTALDEEIREFRPTAVLFPYSSHHQDHQAVYQASISALRTTVDTNFIKLKAMYEYPYVNSWSSNLNPNAKLYYPLTEEDIKRKKSALLSYQSQLLRDHRDILSIPSIIRLARVRGTEIGQSFAEALYPMTIVVD